jgi:hypothetical protein
MRTVQFTTQRLRSRFLAQKVLTFDEVAACLGSPARITVFRKLRALGYRSSYSHAGRYYTLEEVAEFDENGAQLGSFAVVESGTTTPVVLRRLSFDATGDRLFVLTFGAEVFEIATPKAPAVPGLETLGRVALLITTFAVTGLGLRAGRADAASRPQRPGPDPS